LILCKDVRVLNPDGLEKFISELNGTWKKIEDTLNALVFKNFSVRKNVKNTINSEHMEVDICLRV